MDKGRTIPSTGISTATSQVSCRLAQARVKRRNRRPVPPSEIRVRCIKIPLVPPDAIHPCHSHQDIFSLQSSISSPTPAHITLPFSSVSEHPTTHHVRQHEPHLRVRRPAGDPHLGLRLALERQGQRRQKKRRLLAPRAPRSPPRRSCVPSAASASPTTATSTTSGP